MTNTIITRQLVANDQRISHSAGIFGFRFSLCLEPFVYSVTERMARDYDGGYWDFYTLSNGGFYMSPSSDSAFRVSCEYGFEGELSADALGIAACLYTYSNLSFGDTSEFVETCAEQYHLLRDFMLGHDEVRSILKVID